MALDLIVDKRSHGLRIGRKPPATMSLTPEYENLQVGGVAFHGLEGVCSRRRGENVVNRWPRADRAAR